jgi:hypothetical protein
LEKGVAKENLMVIPHSLCGIGEIHLKEKQYDLAEKALKKAKTYSNYDFSQLLGWKVKKSLELLKRSKAGKA